MSPARTLAQLTWLAALWFIGTIVVAVAAARVGTGAATTYGEAHQRFESDWGGKINVQPLVFKVAHDTDAQPRWTVVPEAIALDVDIVHKPRQEGLATMQAFEVTSTDVYTVRNTTALGGPLYVTVTRPEGTRVMRDYALHVAETDRTVRPRSDGAVELDAFVAAGDTRTVTLTWGSKGTDRYRFALSSLVGVMPSFTADIDVDGKNWRVLREGLPHERQGSNLAVDLQNFTSEHDLGVAFRKPKNLNRVATTLAWSPLTLLGLLGGVFVHSQVRVRRFPAFHYAVLACVHVLYFVFAAYLVRMLEPAYAWMAAACLAALLGGLYLPRALGRDFTLRVVLPYALCGTVGLTVAMSVPALQGLAVLSLGFGLLLTVLVPLANADFEQWPLLEEDEPSTELEPVRV